jgi:hypothetical protein
MTEKTQAVGAPLETPVMQHTPGPWRVWCSKDEDGRITVLEVCETQDRGRHSHFASLAKHWPEAEANARLIAAAPELLKCLRSLYCAPMGQGDYAAAGELLRRLGAA